MKDKKRQEANSATRFEFGLVGNKIVIINLNLKLVTHIDLRSL